MTAMGHVARARHLLGLALLVPLALVLSCADLPTSPVPMVRMTGSVRNNEGTPMPFLAVDFWPAGVRIPPIYTVPGNIPPGEPEYYRAITRSDGTFEIWLPARIYDIEVLPWDGSGYSRAWTFSVPVGTETPKWDYRYAWPQVTVRTVQPDGAVIANSRATFYARRPLVPSSTIARPDSDALKAVVPPGSFYIYLYPGGFESGYVTEFLNLQVAADTTITVTSGGNSVSARVVGQNGDPLPGARVHAWSAASSADAQTGGDGIAVFHLPSGSYAFRVTPSESYIARREFSDRTITGPETFDLDVSGTAWSGTVRRAGDGVPLSGIQVDAYANSNEYSFAFIESDAAGAFHLIVKQNVGHHISLVDTQSGRTLGYVPNVIAGSDSTFDLIANVPVP